MIKFLQFSVCWRLLSKETIRESSCVLFVDLAKAIRKMMFKKIKNLCLCEDGIRLFRSLEWFQWNPRWYNFFSFTSAQKRSGISRIESLDSSTSFFNFCSVWCVLSHFTDIMAIYRWATGRVISSLPNSEFSSLGIPLMLASWDNSINSSNATLQE